MMGLCADCGARFETTPEDACAPDCRCAACFRVRVIRVERAREWVREVARARHARVLSGTGDSGDRRELAAFVRGLRS